jgi:integrase
MEENGYSRIYISKLRCDIKRIIAEANANGWISYVDIYQEYATRLSSRQNLRAKRTFLGIIKNFDENGQYPDGQRRHKIVEHGKYHLLNQKYKSFIDYYCMVERERGKKDSTIYTESHNAACFMYYLQQSGCDSLSTVTEAVVLSFFISPEGKLYRNCSYKKNVAAVLKACIALDSEPFGKILAFLPALREKRKNIQYLKAEEIIALKHLYKNKEAKISLRNRAIGILALHTGLRSCDIAGLKMNAIDWEKDRLYIRQQKTDAPLELPLTATVGNAIFDYLKFERPVSDIEYIFISKNRPYGRLKDKSIGNVSNSIMDAASIRLSPGDRRGFHIFRHHLATEMLGNDVPQPVISKVVGHTAPDSLAPYLSADFKHLKECALSIERFPMPKGVLGDV